MPKPLIEDELWVRIEPLLQKETLNENDLRNLAFANVEMPPAAERIEPPVRKQTA